MRSATFWIKTTTENKKKNLDILKVAENKSLA